MQGAAVKVADAGVSLAASVIGVPFASHADTSSEFLSPQPSHISVNFIIIALADERHFQEITVDSVDNPVLADIDAAIGIPGEREGILRLWRVQEVQECTDHLAVLLGV